MPKFPTCEYQQSIRPFDYNIYCETHNENRHCCNPSSNALSFHICGIFPCTSACHGPISHRQNIRLRNLLPSALIHRMSNMHPGSRLLNDLCRHMHRTRSDNLWHSGRLHRMSSICLDSHQICGRVRRRPSTHSDTLIGCGLARPKWYSKIVRYLWRALLETLLLDAQFQYLPRSPRFRSSP